MARRYQTRFKTNADTLSVCYDTNEDLFKWLLDNTAYAPLTIHDTKEQEKEDKKKNYNVIIEITPTLHLEFSRIKEDKNPTELKAIMHFCNYFVGTWKFTNSKQYEKRAWFTASNFVLYHQWKGATLLDPPTTIIDLIEAVAGHFNMTFHNITDLHIALDTNKNVERTTRAYLSDYENYYLYLRGRNVADPDEIFDDVFEMARRSRKRIYKPSLTIQNEGIRVQMYDKTFEQITQGNEKPYIAEVDGFKNIHRIEVRLRNQDFQKVIRAYLRMTEQERKKQFKKMKLNYAPAKLENINVLRMLEDEKFLTFAWRYLTDQTIYFQDKEGNIITLYDIATA